MHTFRFLMIFCIAATAGRVTLHAEAPRAASRPVTYTQTGAGIPRNNDREIESAIRARFAQSKIATNKFEVHVQGGVATLEGHTGVIQHKGTATRLAKAAGARQVVNRIEVSEAARQRASENLAKGRRRAQLKRTDPRSERR